MASLARTGMEGTVAEGREVVTVDSCTGPAEGPAVSGGGGDLTQDFRDPTDFR